MKAIELAKAYDPKSFEDSIYAKWKDEGHFLPSSDRTKKPFTIVIPPPNVTGVLHLGHALDNSLQDVQIRYRRMTGRPTLWVPGTDHAGIATQNVVEKMLRKEGKDRRTMGREAFVEETWKVAKEHKAFINNQLAKIGSSVDWSRERFTLDAGLSKAVREVFVTLYERNLLYKGEYLVNWCTSCGTALSDDEVEHEDENGAMWHIWYELADGPCPECPSGRIEIATTRPETLLGDTAVAVHPEDERYRALIGKMIKLPLTDRTIPLIADAYVDRAFGTGLVKITPAHDPNDFEVGNRHGLERINILNPDGTLSNKVPEKYRGMKVLEARKLVLADLESMGLLKSEEKLVHAVGHCYRCHTSIEPYLSKQWFVRMKPLAEKALKAWQDGDVNFFPKKWEHTYKHWLENIRDWCISRQLWWGHRIPAFYCRHCGAILVEREDPTICAKCGSTDIWQDEDVLDTWFSSWLWPFSTLGWPKDTADLRRFYPTSALVTGYDIIFFWVARMIMAGMEFTEKAPFSEVFIHGLIRDKQGRKMSKSLGNGIDPLEIVDEYGADALKFTLAYNCAAGQDILIDHESFRMGSKFANKVWNASRYILMNLEGRNFIPAEAITLSDTDRWILHRLDEAASQTARALESWRFNDAAQTAYSYFWDDFCDWYIEAAKLSTRFGDDGEKDRATTVLLMVLEESLRLLHPFLPFVTEEIYGMLPNSGGRLISQPWPRRDDSRLNPELAARFDSLRELVTLARTLRSEFQIPPEARMPLSIRFEAGFEGADFLKRGGALIALLVNGPEPRFLEKDASRPVGAVALVGKGFELFVDVKELVDTAKLVAKLDKDIQKESAFVAKVRAKLANQAFVASAPAEIVAQERQKGAEAESKVAKLRHYIEELS
ncbi:MAG: valine--tRNA ligase [Spirochaetae bacterium HGW-Spirochaetae-9]|nr:MAG: valine--tRNA ligase [Spirochaetae bacterium HGW-Spirochaetae-9]